MIQRCMYVELRHTHSIKEGLPLLSEFLGTSTFCLGLKQIFYSSPNWTSGCLTNNWIFYSPDSNRCNGYLSLLRLHKHIGQMANSPGTCNLYQCFQRGFPLFQRSHLKCRLRAAASTARLCKSSVSIESALSKLQWTYSSWWTIMSDTQGIQWMLNIDAESQWLIIIMAGKCMPCTHFVDVHVYTVHSVHEPYTLWTVRAMHSPISCAHQSCLATECPL